MILGPRLVPKIGLEVHCQLATRSKLFSACPHSSGAPANAQTDAYTLALPGTLPVLNRAAVELAIRMALGVGAEIQASSGWARKHYFYPDLPKGYQITQHAAPLARGGAIEVGGRKIRLQRIHLEEDAGKSVYADGVRLVDFNRAGAPLLEIVGEPDITTPQEAAGYLRELRAIVRALGVSEADMEEGQLRCDANVSIWPEGQPGQGPRCELKNLNSFVSLELAIAAELRRQAAIVTSGAPVRPLTLGYDPHADRTVVLRAKEAQAEYRFLPEPDLPPLWIADGWVERVRASLPELPAARRARFRGLGLSAADVARLDAPGLARFFDAALAELEPTEAPRLCHWLCGDLLGLLHAHGQAIASSPVTPSWLARVVTMVATGRLTGPNAKAVLARCHAERRDPLAIAAEGFTRVEDDAAIEAAIAVVLAENPRQLAAYRGGKAAVKAYFAGLVIRATGGRADPRRVQALLDRALDPS